MENISEKPPPYKSIEPVETQPTVQDPTQSQYTVETISVPEETSLCECDGSWWGGCCISLCCAGLGGLYADFKLKNRITGKVVLFTLSISCEK